MKTLIAALLLASTSAFAADLDAPSALLKTLPEGSYRGLTTTEEDCVVRVQRLSTGVSVTVSSRTLSKGHETLNASNYRWNPGQRLFFSSVMERTSNSSTESFVRTIAVEEKTQYVVAGEIFRSNSGTKESVVECIVNL